MKRLCLFRHAKSTWGAIGTEDIDRPLDPRGDGDAPLMAKYLTEQGIKLELLMSSHAKRALKTADLIADALNYDKNKIVVNENIYEATVDDLIHVIQGINSTVKTAVLVGHNPALTLLANYLADVHVNNLPTCGVIGIEFKTNDWTDIINAGNKVLFISDPSKVS